MIKKAVYVAIADDLRSMIINNEYQTMELIPSESQLCSHFNVSRTTIRRALAILTSENYLSSVPGKGYVVNVPDRNKYNFEFDEFNCLTKPVDESKLLCVELIPSTVDLMLTFRISKKIMFIKLERLLLFEGTPLEYDSKYIPYHPGIPIIEKEINYATFPKILTKDTSVNLNSQKLKIQSVKANKETSKILNIKKNTPVMLVEETLFDEKTNIIGWSQMFFNSDYFKIVLN